VTCWKNWKDWRKKVLDEKYSIELQLKDKEKSQGQNSIETDQLRDQIVNELRRASIASMLDKIRKKRVGQRRNTKVSRHHIRIVKSVTIPQNLPETIEPISHDQLPTGNVTITLRESESQLVHQHSFLSNPQSFTRNNHVESEEGERTMEEPVNANMTETPWTSENEESDIKYEIQNHSDMTIDPLQLESEHSDVLQVCGAGFFRYNQLKNHDRIHLKSVRRSSTMQIICGKKGIGKSHHKTTNVIPSLRPKRCEECGKILSSHRAWTNHFTSFHQGQHKFKCTQCNYGCREEYKLRRHILTVHSVKNEDLKCSKCDRVFESKRGLSRHMLSCLVAQQ